MYTIHAHTHVVYLVWHAFRPMEKDKKINFEQCQIYDPFVLSSYQQIKLECVLTCAIVWMWTCSKIRKKAHPSTVNLFVQCQSVLIICQFCWIYPYDFVPRQHTHTHMKCFYAETQNVRFINDLFICWTLVRTST